LSIHKPVNEKDDQLYSLSGCAVWYFLTVGEDGVVKEKSVLATIGGVMVGMQRFMKQLTQ
jgi:hypothetical protein